MKTTQRVLALAVAGALVFSPFTGAAQEREVPETKSQVMLSYAPVVKKAAPAVVNIYTKKRVRQRVMPLFADPFFQQFFGGVMPQGPMRERLESALGSGVIVDPSGLVMTSNHVIDGAQEITAVLPDRREFGATVLAADEKTDLAVLKIEAKDEVLPFIQIKDSDMVEVGDIVLAIGNPFGVGQTVTSGIVSALARTNLDVSDINYFIQTDAAINPGNSGGALVTMDGRLIGINSAIFTRSGGSMGLGFAVPSNMVRVVLAGVAKGEKKLVRPWTGIKSQEVTSELARSLGLARPEGLLVNGLHPASPAKEAGVEVADVITHVNGKAVEDPSAFAYRIATLPVGGTVDLTVVRKGKILTVAMKRIPPPETPPRQETELKGSNPLAGATVANFSPALAEDYGLVDEEDGVIIVAIAGGSPAARLGLVKGDMILAINDEEIEKVADVQAALNTETRTWRLAIKREGGVMDLLIRG